MGNFISKLMNKKTLTYCIIAAAVIIILLIILLVKFMSGSDTPADSSAPSMPYFSQSSDSSSKKSDSSKESGSSSSSKSSSSASSSKPGTSGSNTQTSNHNGNSGTNADTSTKAEDTSSAEPQLPPDTPETPPTAGEIIEKSVTELSGMGTKLTLKTNIPNPKTEFFSVPTSYNLTDAFINLTNQIKTKLKYQEYITSAEGDPYIFDYEYNITDVGDANDNHTFKLEYRFKKQYAAGSGYNTDEIVEAMCNYLNQKGLTKFDSQTPETVENTVPMVIPFSITDKNRAIQVATGNAEWVIEDYRNYDFIYYSKCDVAGLDGTTEPGYKFYLMLK